MRRWKNRTAALAALGCAATLTATALAAPKQMTAEDAIKREYPDAKVEVVDTRPVNGVKVEDLKITTAKGQSTAKVTEFGDFVLVGEQRGDNSISQPAMDTLSGLFKAGQQDVDCYRVTSYVVDVSSGKKDFRLTFDPVGRLHDIVNVSELSKEDSSKLEKIDDKDKGLKADDYAKKYTEGATVEAVYKSPVGDDFFLVDMKEKNGKDARITLDNTGRVFSFRDEIDTASAPKPVVDGLNEMFSGAKINHAYRYEYQYYQLDKTTADGDRVTIQIRPNGDVMSVHNEGVEKATAAAAAKKKKN